ncbi:hypothetical protein A2U01_0096948, partial [Trifolium medium]|nr:hypothetical protein [Trifolium medium]
VVGGVGVGVGGAADFFGSGDGFDTVEVLRWCLGDVVVRC